MINNSMKLEFDSRSDNEKFARSVAAAFILPLDPTIEQLSEIKTAVSEAVTNAIIHGYCEDCGRVVLEGSIDEGSVEFIITDSGNGIEDIKRAREPLFTGRPEMERSGMGFTIMEAFMDTVTVDSEIGKGTRVVMRKKII